MEMEQEVVYGTHEDSHVVMSEKVQSLAGSIYQEFEKMIGKYDEEVVKDLMPLVVNVLESLDLSYTENQEHEVELELLREDNEQLVTQYEREKQLRKTSEQKLLEVEDASEDERKELGSKVESLESIVRMFELKSKNSSDHVNRLEEKEAEHQREYSKLHERYTELFKTHVDHLERSKPTPQDRAEPSRPRLPALMQRSAGPLSMGFASMEHSAMHQPRSHDVSDCSGPGSPPDSSHSGASLRLELLDVEPASPPEDNTPETPVPEPPSPAGRSHTNREQRSGNTLYQELSFQDADALGEMDDGVDITGSWVHPGDFASSVNDNFFGMGKEVENLIMENNELLATKNALNIVKDDLIEQVDELTAQHEILRAQLRAAAGARARLDGRVNDLEDELRRARDELETASRANRSDDDEDVPMAQRKRFTRVEMARVLMERNQYKERFMELQEAVRWTEMIRASRHEPELDRKNKQSVWKFFSSLFGPADRRPLGAVGPGGPGGGPGSARPPLDAVRRRAQGRRDGADDKVAQRRAAERREQLRQVRAHVRKEDGRLQAYGWSLPARAASRGPAPPASHVPVPVYCRPPAEEEPGTKIWCAAGAAAEGGLTPDGGRVVGGSVFYPPGAAPDATPATPPAPSADSLVWICTSAHAAGRVTVVDANNPADVLDAFDVCASHLLCIASVPGASAEDYGGDAEEAALEALEGEAAAEGVEGRAAGHVRAACSSPAPDEPAPRDPPPPSRIDRELSPAVRDGLTAALGEEALSMCNVQATMWLGSQDGSLYVHSAVAQWRRRVAAAKLRDAILGIVHVSGRVVVALADGTVASFGRGRDGAWDLSRYLLLDLGRPHHSIRCLATVGDKVWCGYRNQLHVVDPRSLAVDARVDAHPRKESQVRQLAPQGEGVWVSIRLDSTLRLFHATTLQHLQDVDIEPYVSKMLAVFPGGTGKLGFSFVRITALLIAGQRLWIGTGNGVVISVPLSAAPAAPSTTPATPGPGGVVRVADAPFCSMAQAQLSFHGHRDAVKFFVAVPGCGSLGGGGDEGKPEGDTSMLVMSGGEGYIDFRVGEEEAGPADGGEHLLVWRLMPSGSVCR